jgi:internalin A
MSGKPHIFVSYAHDDTEWLKTLDPWLKGLRQYAEVEYYDDRQGLGGVDWDAQIKANLETADIFLAVVTANFIASQYIHETELPIARRRRDEGTCIIMPLYMRRCHYRLLDLSNSTSCPKMQRATWRP